MITESIDHLLAMGEPIRHEKQLLSWEDAYWEWLGVRRRYGLSVRTTQPYTSPGSASSKLKKNPVPTNWVNFAPALSSGLGNNCPFHTEGCSDGCVMKEGRLSIPYNQTVQTARTALAKDNLLAAVSLIWHESEAMVRSADGLKCGRRLNGSQDWRWEKLAPVLFKQPIENYDYTKWPLRSRKKRPENYHLTYSASEDTTDREIHDYLGQGINVAVLLRVKKGVPLPTEWHGFPVIDGDVHDFRPDDPKGVIVGLRAKGRAMHDTTGFTREVD